MSSAWFAAGFPSPDTIAAIFVPLGMFSVPIIWILTRHQRQMAEIIHGRRYEEIRQSEMESMRAEIAELRSQLRALGPASETGASEEIKQRLG